jgi:hypothetical protein
MDDVDGPDRAAPRQSGCPPSDHPDARPQDPRTNTRPRGNGPMDRGETEKSARKLETVLGH